MVVSGPSLQRIKVMELRRKRSAVRLCRRINEVATIFEAEQPPGNVGRIFAQRGLLPPASTPE
jgi:hypothetical protein